MQHNFTALELAMARNSQARVTQALLKAGADIDSINARSVRPLFKELIEASSIVDILGTGRYVMCMHYASEMFVVIFRRF